MADGLIRYVPPLTVRRFLLSDARVRGLMGPFGSGKSSGCVMEVVRRAMQQMPDAAGVRRTRFGVVRNTKPQLRDTTIKTFFEWFPPHVYGRYVETKGQYMMEFDLPDGTRVECEVMFIALDREEDIAKLLSLELTGLWFNECREINPTVFEAAGGRVGRFPKIDPDAGYYRTWSGVWYDSNPPQEGSWLWARQEQVDPEDHTRPMPNKWAVFKQPSGRSAEAENLRALNQGPGDDYYNTEDRTKEYVRVYIDGQYGLASAGQPVHPDFDRRYHVSPVPLRAQLDRERPIIVGMDCGRRPAAVIGQAGPGGRCVVLREVLTSLRPEEGSGNQSADRFIRNQLGPVLRQEFGRHEILIYIDPAGQHPGEADERTVLFYLKRYGLNAWPAATNNRLEHRVGTLDQLLARQVDGGYAAFLIDPRCVRLVNALSHGYRWAPPSARVATVGEVPRKVVKDMHSHVAEACHYMAIHIAAPSRGLYGGAAQQWVQPIPVGWA